MCKKRPTANPSSVDTVLQLKNSLLGGSPQIWRRVLVPASATLGDLHGLIQVAMGWQGTHSFLFPIQGFSAEPCK